LRPGIRYNERVVGTGRGCWLLACGLLLACGDSTADGGTAGTGSTGTADAGTALGGRSGSGASGGGSSGAGCDLSGTWIAQRVLFTLPDTPLASASQKVSSWDLYDIEQDGDDVTVTDHLFCGIVTTGDARVGLSDDSIRAMQAHLDQSGRKGTFTEDGDDCVLDMERVYIVMGASPIAYYRAGVAEAPGRIDGEPPLSMLEPMPTKAGNPGADDWDDDGKPGLQFIITDSPLGSGVRHATQRDWHVMHGRVPAGSDAFQVDVEWDFEETILEASNPFFGSSAKTREGFPHGALWRRYDTPRADDGAETCRDVRDTMPHEPLPRDEI